MNNPVKEGEIVLVVNDDKRRQNWRLAIVTRVHHGRDGNMWVAELRTAASREPFL